ncbi:uncharacterized protein [Ptychodera flava]|uniref:uncharacterized protein n=1 Tax=Ptychodera flava TaxID=63121 RepID=UPI003969E46F
MTKRKGSKQKNRYVSSCSEASPDSKRSKMADAGTSNPNPAVPIHGEDKDLQCQLADIMKALTAFREKIDKIPCVEERLTELQKSVDFMNTFFEQMKEEMKELKTEIANTKEENAALRDQLTAAHRDLGNTKDELNELQQYSRRNNLEIHGIPQHNNEDTDNIVIKIAAAIGVDVTSSDIDISHRLPRRHSQQRERQLPPPIIVKFVRRSVRNTLYYSRRNLQGKTPTHLHLDDNATNSIFINENLSPSVKRLFHQVNDRRKHLKWRYIWTNNGKIYTRKDDTSDAIIISSLQAISRLT